MFLLYPWKNEKINQNVIHWTITLITTLFGIVHFKTNYNYRLSNHCSINELILVTYALISNAVEKKTERMAANFLPDMHLQECLRNYELSIVPIALFAADGTMLHCSAKSKLMASLEKMSSAETFDVAPPDLPQPNKCFAIIDTRADVQSMDKRSWIKTCKDQCKDLSAHFNAFIQRKYDEYD